MRATEPDTIKGQTMSHLQVLALRETRCLACGGPGLTGGSNYVGLLKQALPPGSGRTQGSRLWTGLGEWKDTP